MDKPEVDLIEGLSPAISIDQRSASANPRSTVGTITEIYDYLRLIFSRIGLVYCPHCQIQLKKQTATQILGEILNLVNNGDQLIILAPANDKSQANSSKDLTNLKKLGFGKVRVNGLIKDLDQTLGPQTLLEKKGKVEIVVGQLKYLSDKLELIKDELLQLIKLALDLGDGRLLVLMNSSASLSKADKEKFFSQHYTCQQCGFSLSSLEPRNFSFNSPAGACLECLGLGTRLEVDADLVIPNQRLTLAQGAIKPWARNFSNQNIYWQLLEAVAAENHFSLSVAVQDLPAGAKEIIFLVQPLKNI
jgi:excinuclease ABC subunit A